MRGLKEFQRFDVDAFLKDKDVVFVSETPLFDYIDGQKSEQAVGVRLSCVIVRDDTEYTNRDINNEFEKIDVKIRGISTTGLQKRTPLKIRGVGKVWGDYSQNLTIETTRENIKIARKQKNDE